jgi:hypothetical protein
MSPHEFRGWYEACASCPDDDYWHELSARAIEIELEAYKQSWTIAPAVAEAYAGAIKWAAFWLAAGAVTCAVVIKGMP